MAAQIATNTTGCAPHQVMFTAPAGASTVFWDFGDGSSNDDANNPTNTYISPGTYTARFGLTEGNYTDSVIINVFAKPNLEIAQDPNPACAPAAITLTNTTAIPDGVSLVSTEWAFFDGTGASGTSIQKDFPVGGAFSVSVAIETNIAGCDVTQNFADFIEITPAPATAFTADQSLSACTGPLDLLFNNQTPGNDLQLEWDFGNGNTWSGDNPPLQTYTEDGNYTVSLTATNIQGCTRTTTRQVSIGLPVAEFTIADTVCSGNEDLVLLNRSSAGAYTWTVTGPASFSSTAANPNYDFPVGGTYEVKLEVVAEEGACRNEVTKTVIAQQLDASFTADPVNSCNDPQAVVFTPNNTLENVTYSWMFGDDSTSTEANPTHIYDADNESPFDPNGEFPFTPVLMLTSSAGCESADSTEIILDIPLARFMPDTVSGCAPLTVEFSDSSQSTQPIVNWEWIYADGNTANFEVPDAHSYTYNNPGEYDVQLVITNDKACQDTSYVIRVEVGERITPDFTTDKTSVCQGEPIQFMDATNNENIDEWHYYTNNGRSSHCFDDGNPIIPFDSETGQFDVQLVVGYNGCLDSITRTDFIEVKGPIARIDWMQNCETPNTVMFTSNSGDATDLSWTFGEGGTGTQVNETYDYSATGDYQVVLTAQNASSGCAPSVDSALIQIRNIEAIGEVEMEQCKDIPLMLMSGESVDVDTVCFRGYTWHFNHPSVRPVTTNMPMVDDISYPDTGNYLVELVVEDVNGCVDTARFPVVVHEAMVSFDIDRTELCSPQSIEISNVVATTTSESIESYMWDFGDGVGMSEEANPNSYTYNTGPASGGNVITITVQVEDDAGCPGDFQRMVEYYTPQSFINAGDVSLCVGEPFTANGTEFIRDGVNRPLSYAWTFGNNETAATQAVQTTYTEGGIYNVEMEYTEIGTPCTQTATQTVQVHDIPVAAFTTDLVDGEPLCAPTFVDFTDNSMSMVDLSRSWDFGNGGSGVGTSVTAPYNDPGTFTVELSVSTAFGCTDVATETFTFEQGPTAEIEVLETDFCVGDEVTASVINQMDVTDFSWEFEGNTFGENETTVTIPITRVATDGSAPIKLNLVGAGGCNTAIESRINVTTGGSNDFTVEQVPGGCFRVQIRPTNPNGFPVGNTVDYGADGIGSGLIFDYDAAGTYTITVSGGNAGICGNNEPVIQTVTVGSLSVGADSTNIEGGELFIPNVFSPNGDNIQDIFRVSAIQLGQGQVDDCQKPVGVRSYRIFNRWGKEVYAFDGEYTFTEMDR
ncbi:MAG: PKD domain-containing protein, partial [Bacteroidota bacterium]